MILLAEALRSLGYGLCHQIPERSFSGGGIQLPVCARDTGIYVGFVVSVAVLQMMGRSRRSEPPSWRLVALGASFLVLMAIDGVNSNTGLLDGVYATTNATRLATGLMTGSFVALLATPVVNGQLWRDPVSVRVVSGGRDTAVWLGAMPLAFAAVWWLLPLLGAIYPAAVAVCVLVTFWWVNLAIVCMLPPLERRARRLSDVPLAHAAAVGLTVIELGFGAAFRALLERLAG